MLRVLFLLAFLALKSISGARLVFAEDIRDVKPPVVFPVSYSFFIGVLVAIVIVLGILWIQSKLKNRQPKIVRVTQPRSPWEAAYEKLAELKQADFPKKGKIKEYYSVLSEIVRRYIEERFDIRAPEMTTEEFLRQLRASGKLTQAQKSSLKEFLECSDKVKFAKHVTTMDDMEQSFLLAKKLIDETKKQNNAGSLEHAV